MDTSDKPSLIIVFGMTGAGKTTYCDHLFSQSVGHVFSIDRWMKALYWQDMPDQPDIKWFQDNQDWYVQRIARCESLITQEVNKLLALGTSCILDLGFSTVAHRQTFIQLGEKAKVNITLHFLDVPKQERWQRVEKRNSEQAATFSMHVDEGMFNYMEDIFEPCSETEAPYLVTITT